MAKSALAKRSKRKNMTEVEQNSEVAAVAPQATNENHVEQTQIAETRTQVDDRNERNWRAMRMQNDELKKKLEERDALFEKMLAAQLAQAQPKQEPDELDLIEDTAYLDKGKIQKLVEKKASKLAEDVAKREVEKYIKSQNDSQFMQKLQREFSDFEDIVNPETLSLLETQEPKLAQTIADLKDPYKIGVQSYKFIKAMGLIQKAPQARREKEIEKKIEDNGKSVQSPMAFDKRPLAQAFKLTDAEKKNLYREMMGFAASANSVPTLT